MQNRPTLKYSFRITLTFLALALTFVLAGRTYYDEQSVNIYRMLDLMGQVDVYRSLFYSLGPVCLLLLLIPARNGGVRHIAISIAVTVAAAIPVFAVVYPAVGHTRPFLPSGGLYFFACLLLAANAGLLFSLQLARPLSEIPEQIIDRGIVIFDLLAPMAVWAAARHRSGLRLNLFKPLPVAYLAALVCLPFFVAPLPVRSPIYTHPAFENIAPGSFFQVMVDPENGDLIAVEEGEYALYRIDPRRRTVTAVRKLPGLDRNISMAGFDAQTRKLVLAELSTLRTYVIDADTLTVLRIIPIRKDRDDLGITEPCRTYWLRDKNLLAAFCNDGLYRLCPDGASIDIGYPRCNIGDLIYDSDHRRLYVESWENHLVSIDPATFKIDVDTRKDFWSERLELDESLHRLYLPYPMIGRVEVYDNRTLKPKQVFRAFPGTRVMKLIPGTDRMLVGGLSPVLEIRSRYDFSLIDRVVSPPWIRYIEPLPDSGRIVFSTGGHGLWSVDPSLLGPGSPGYEKRMSDPFYPVFDLAVHLVSDLLHLRERAVGSAIDFDLEKVGDQRCGTGVWYD